MREYEAEGRLACRHGDPAQVLGRSSACSRWSSKAASPPFLNFTREPVTIATRERSRARGHQQHLAAPGGELVGIEVAAARGARRARWDPQLRAGQLRRPACADLGAREADVDLDAQHLHRPAGVAGLPLALRGQLALGVGLAPAVLRVAVSSIQIIAITLARVAEIARAPAVASASLGRMDRSAREPYISTSTARLAARRRLQAELPEEEQEGRAGGADVAGRAGRRVGMPALGLTDHGVMNGAVEHYKACREHGIKPIIGMEAYLVDDETRSRTSPATSATTSPCSRTAPRASAIGEAELGGFSRASRGARRTWTWS